MSNQDVRDPSGNKENAGDSVTSQSPSEEATDTEREIKQEDSNKPQTGELSRELDSVERHGSPDSLNDERKRNDRVPSGKLENAGNAAAFEEVQRNDECGQREGSVITGNEHRDDDEQTTLEGNDNDKSSVSGTKREKHETDGNGINDENNDGEEQKQQEEDNIGHPRVCGLCEEGFQAEGRCMDCSEDLCSSCIKYHEKLRVTASHNVLPFEPGATSDIVVPSRSSADCQKHKEPLKFFCKICKVAVCRDCVLTIHKDHQAVDLDDEVGNAKKEVEKLLKRVQNHVRRTEREMGDLQIYHQEFLGKVENVRDVIEQLHTSVLQRVERSHKELSKMMQVTKDEEMRRVDQLENFLQQRLRSASDFTAVADHVLSSQDGIEVMVKLEMLRQSVSPICQHGDMEKGHAEFFLTKNLRFTGNTAENILGRVAFSVMSPPVGASNENKTFIREIRLSREVAFHIWEMHCTKPSVKGIVEGSNGMMWIATPRSLLTVADTGNRKISTHLNADVAGITGGPDGSLLVVFDKGTSIKMFSNESWSNFSTVPGQITALTNNGIGQRILIPQMLRNGAKLLVVCNLGRDAVSLDLPKELTNTYIPSLAVAPDGEVALCVSKAGIVVLLSSSFDYKTDYHGPDGVLYPRSVCYDKLGHLIVADSKRCTVQLVSKDGHFLCYLLNKEDFQDIGSPTSVTVDSRGRLWIGTGNGNVCAYTYMHDIM